MNEIPRRITVGMVFGWFLGILFTISGMAAFFSAPLSALFFLATALILLPPANAYAARKWNFTLSGGVKFILIVILFVLAGVTLDSKQPPSEDPNVSPTPTNTATDSAGTTTPVPGSPTPIPRTPTPVPATQAPPASTETVSQKNAAKKAKDYLSFTAFSRDGLVAQLEYEKFSHADAVYGADHSGANWFEQAAKKARQYMEYSAFSRGGLIEQLKYEKFTQEQAEYGADSVGL